MNSTFASRITELRKERGISQKEAAAALGVSQALLSHYEKGVRECSLNFVCKASAYYDVSCDYLLGQIDARRSLDDEFDLSDVAQDKEFRTSTLFRAAAILRDNLGTVGSGTGDKIKNYFALAIYRVAVCAAEAGVIPKAWIGLELSKAAILSLAVMAELSDKSQFDSLPDRHKKSLSEPLCVKTVIENAEQLLIKTLSSVSPPENQ